MRFKGRMELEHGLRQLDIVPLINIVFLLLIFFMLTPNFIMQPAIKVSLPRAVTSEAVKFENIEILLTRDNLTYLDTKLMTQEELKLLFKQAALRNEAVLIKADRRASLGRIVEIWDIARDLGISQINVATNKE